MSRSFLLPYVLSAVVLLAGNIAFAVTRTEFKQKVKVGMTLGEVKQAAGKPSSTQEGEEGKDVIWYYENIFDEEAEKDGRVQCVFDGKSKRLRNLNFY